MNWVCELTARGGARSSSILSHTRTMSILSCLLVLRSSVKAVKSMPAVNSSIGAMFSRHGVFTLCGATAP
jgi:hypothetical protein